MLRKLLKYDLKYMIKNMSIFYILSIFAAVLTRIFFSLNQTTFINVVGQICVGLMFSMIFSTLINTIIRSWVRFSASLYGDESYLSHTLPVTKKELYEAKFIGGIIFTLIGFAVVIVSLLIAYASKDNFAAIKNSVEGISNSLNINVYLFLGVVVVILFLEIFNAIQSGFIGIIIGQRYSDRKLMYTFIYGFVAYLASQLVCVLAIFITGLFNSNVMSLFTSNDMLDNTTLIVIGIVSIVTYLITILGINLTAVKLFQNKVNIE